MTSDEPISVVTYPCGCQDAHYRVADGIIGTREHRHGCHSRFGRKCRRDAKAQ